MCRNTVTEITSQAWALSWNSWNFKSGPEIYSMSWFFCRCPEIFEHTWPCCGYTSIYISFREWTPPPMWASDPTVDPENWRTYSYCDTAEGTKQTMHLYCRFRVTTVFLVTLMAPFQRVCIFYVFYFLSWKNYCAQPGLDNSGRLLQDRACRWLA